MLRPDPRQTYSARGAARVLGVDPKTVLDSIRAGDLRAYVLGKRKFTIVGQDLIDFIESRSVGNDRDS